MGKHLPRIGLTMGDPAGIGPEIIAKALSQKRIHDICQPLIIGDSEIIRDGVQIAGFEQQFAQAHRDNRDVGAAQEAEAKAKLEEEERNTLFQMKRLREQGRILPLEQLLRRAQELRAAVGVPGVIAHMGTDEDCLCVEDLGPAKGEVQEDEKGEGQIPGADDCLRIYAGDRDGERSCGRLF